MKKKNQLIASIMIATCFCMMPLLCYALDEEEDRFSDRPRVDGKAVETTSDPLEVAEHIDEHWEEGTYREGGSDYQLERIIVRTEGDIADSCGAEDAIHNNRTDEYILEYDSIRDTKDAYAALTEEYGEENVMLDTLISIQNAAVLGSSHKNICVDWGTHLMGLDSLKEESMVDHKVVAPKHETVAILDTGINAKHVMFRDRVILPSSKSFIPSESALKDDHGHGTSVAGIIADATCRHVDFLVLKVMDKNGQGGMYNVIRGIDYAAEHGAGVINLSIGVDGIKPDSVAYNLMEASLEKARAKGAVIVTAAGNGDGAPGKDLDKVYSYPAYSPNTIAVGAIDRNLKRASFSYYGKSLDFVAPGKSVRSAWKGNASSYRKVSGTSMAAPEISAAAIMVKVEHSSYDSDEILEVLLEDSVDIGPKGRDRYYGNGYVKMKSTSYTAVHQTLLGGAVIDAEAHRSAVDPVKLKRLSGSKGVVRVVWSKGRNINGYQVRFSKKKSMVNPKIKTVTNPSKTRLAVKGLRGSRTWYVQVRCYKKVDGEVYCSKWSGKKKVRIY